MKKRRKNGRDRGASLVSVIIAMAVVTMLGVSAVYVTYSNLNRKYVDRRSKDNAYSAESALDEIVAGLQAELSSAFSGAYAGIMSRYGNYSSSAEMDRAFQVDVITAVVESLHQPTAVDEVSQTVTTESYGKYSLALLRGYVTGNYTGSLSVDSDNNALDTLADAVVLRNLRVTYVDSGYENKITTDIRIDVPAMHFSRVSTLPNLGMYTNIANKGVIVTGNNSLTLKGEAYVGADSGKAVVLENGAMLDGRNSALLTCGGSIDLKSGSRIYTGEGTSLWTTDILAMASNEVELMGNTYVQDDLTLKGADSSVTLGGSYFGLGEGDRAADSSAIVINGMGSTINMSAIETLVLMGTAYVSGSSADGTAPSGLPSGNIDVKTGESVAVKSNQLAYLVPTECEGITTNPMSYNQYKKLTNNGADITWAQKALDTILPSLGTTIRSYGSVQITPVFTQEQGGSVYLFLNFSSTDAASRYFLDTYKSTGTAGEQLRKYLPLYLENFVFPVEESAEQMTLTRLVTEGNYLLPGAFNTDTLRWEGDPSYTAAITMSDNVSTELSNYRSIYASLCAKLVTSSAWLSDEEMSRNVYANLIDESAIDRALAGNVSNGAEKSGSKITFTGANGTKVIVVKGDYTLDSTESATGGLVIATGNLTVTKNNWKGVLICGGKLSVNAPLTIAADEEVMGEALSLHCDLDTAENGGLSVNEFFVGGEEYAANQGTDDQKTMNIEDCVTLQNWRAE